MGMFDCIDFKIKCPTCGKMVEGFQSKDNDCSLDLLQISDVNNFYSSCDNCETWIEFNHIRGHKTRKIEDYKMTIEVEENTNGNA